jgi:hypothetical protein
MKTQDQGPTVAVSSINLEDYKTKVKTPKKKVPLQSYDY